MPKGYLIKGKSLTLLVSHRQVPSNSSEDQRGCQKNKSLDLLSSPLEVDEQRPLRPLSASAVSKSESTASSKVFSASSDRPHSRHTANTSLDSTHQAKSSRESEDSSISASNDQLDTSSGWSPATSRSTEFNIDDYISSDDDSFTTAKKGSRITADGEEELLFKAGYGITGGALPGLEELEEDEAVYPCRTFRSSRSDSVSSNGSAAVAVGPIDNRFSMALEIPTLLRHTRSDPEMELYSGTFGQRPIPHGLKGSETCRSAGEEQNASSTADTNDEFKQSPDTTMVDSEDGMDGDMLTQRRGLIRLSALGNRQSDDIDLKPETAQSKKADTRKEMEISTAIRLRKEEKAKRRAEELTNRRGKRLSKTFTEMGKDMEMAKLIGELDHVDEDRGHARSIDDDCEGEETAVE